MQGRIIKQVSFFLLILALHVAANAANSVQITNVYRASNYDLGDGSSRPIIYGGISGSYLDCDTSDTTTMCNNCVNPDVACNRTRIHPNLLLRIEFKVTADIEGDYVFLGYNNGTENEFTSTSYTRTSGPFTKGSTGYVQIAWSELCGATSATLYGDPACEGGTNITGDDLSLLLSIEDTADFDDAATTEITVKIMAPAGLVSADTLACADTTPSAGICGFKAYPGDEKAYISDLDIVGSCPTEYKYARVFYTTDYTGGLASANYNFDTYKDLKLGTDCSPEGEWIVDGLTNNIQYLFRISILDVAGNNAFISNQADMQASFPACVPPVNAAGAAAADAACPYISTPGKVVGLLPEDFNCFIATAAYGSGFYQKLSVLRKFRNEILLTTELGTKFVHAYYQFGPKAAAVIRERPWLRKITQVALAPVWGVAWFALHYGAFGTMIVLLSLLFIFTFGIRQFRRGQF